MCLVCHAVVVDACEPDKLPFFEKDSAPQFFPSNTGFLVVGKPHPNPPCIIHATGRYIVLGSGSYHGGLGDWYMCIFRHLLVEFLFSNINGESSAGINWFVEFVEIFVNLRLGDCCIFSHDIVIDAADGDPV